MKPNELKRKPRKKRNVKLNAFEFLEMSEYTKEELNELFEMAIWDMCSKQILSPEEAKDYMKNYKQWLKELLET